MKRLKTKKGTRGKFLIVLGVVYILQLLTCLVVDIRKLSEASLYLAYMNPYFHIFWEGLLGILLCDCMPEIQQKMESWNQNVLETGALIVFLGFFLLNNFTSISIWRAWIWFVPVSFVLIAFYRDSGRWSGIAKGRFWQFLGNISFELYMTHAFVYEGIPVLAGIVSGNFRKWIQYHAGMRFGLTLITSVVFAWVVHQVFDRRYRKGKQRK